MGAPAIGGVFPFGRPIATPDMCDRHPEPAAEIRGDNKNARVFAESRLLEWLYSESPANRVGCFPERQAVFIAAIDSAFAEC